MTSVPYRALMAAMGGNRSLAGSSETEKFAYLTASIATQSISVKSTEPVFARPNPRTSARLAADLGTGRIRVNFQLPHGKESVESTNLPADPV